MHVSKYGNKGSDSNVIGKFEASLGVKNHPRPASYGEKSTGWGGSGGMRNFCWCYGTPGDK